MNEVRDAVRQVLDRLLDETEQVKATLAHVAPDDVNEVLPACDRALRGVFESADGCRRLLTLYRPSLLALYDPLDAARSQSARLVGPSMASRMNRQFKGDVEQVKECLRLLLENGDLAQGGTLALEVYVDEDHPRVVARLTDEANLPTVLQLPGPFNIPFAEFAERWNGATGGGRVDATCAGLVMNLQGTRRPPESSPWAREVLQPMITVTRQLMPWRGAIGNYDYGAEASTETLDLYRQTVDAVAARLRNASQHVPSS